MNTSTGSSTDQTVEIQVANLESIRDERLFDLNHRLEYNGSGRVAAETRHLDSEEAHFRWTFNTIPEHLMEAGYALDNLHQLISLRIEQLENPNEVVIFDLPTQLDSDRYEGSTPVRVDTFHRALIMFYEIPNELRAVPVDVPEGLFPVSFRLTIPPRSTPNEMSHLCRDFENTVARYQRYEKAYNWTLSVQKIKAAKEGDEIDEVLLHSECIAIYRKDVKKRIGALLLDHPQYWVPNHGSLKTE